MTTIRRPGALALAIPVALILAGCGTSAEDASGETTPSETASGVTADPVVLSATDLESALITVDSPALAGFSEKGGSSDEDVTFNAGSVGMAFREAPGVDEECRYALVASEEAPSTHGDKAAMKFQRTGGVVDVILSSISDDEVPDMIGPSKAVAEKCDGQRMDLSDRVTHVRPLSDPSTDGYFQRVIVDGDGLDWAVMDKQLNNNVIRVQSVGVSEAETRAILDAQAAALTERIEEAG